MMNLEKLLIDFRRILDQFCLKSRISKKNIENGLKRGFSMARFLNFRKIFKRF